MGPGGSPIEFKLLADAEHMDDLEAAIEECKEYLHRQKGVIDISDDSRPGKWEFQITVKDDARTLGVPLAGSGRHRAGRLLRRRGDAPAARAA